MPLFAIPVLEVELAVDASEATDMRSRSAGSVSEESPNRARLSREVLVGLGLGALVALLVPEEGGGCVILARLDLVLAVAVWALGTKPLGCCVEVGCGSDSREFEFTSSSVRSRDVHGRPACWGAGVLPLILRS